MRLWLLEASPMTDTAAERKALEREGKRARGLRPMEVWVPEQCKDEVREFVAKLLECQHVTE